MTKDLKIKVTTEVKNVKYVDVPRTISKLLRNGFAIGDIIKIRTDCSHYDFYATRYINVEEMEL